MPDRWMVYGANGYTGRLIVAEAVRRGLRPLVAGRNAEAVEAVAAEFGLESAVFPLQKLPMAWSAMRAVRAVVHCAGPFLETSRPMLDLCIETQTHYLDITGEIQVFEAILARGDELRMAGISAVPGVGFDVVPTDCLAAALAAELPSATELRLAFDPRGGEISRGTLKTMIEGLPFGGAVRMGGKIVRVPAAYETREIPFGAGPRLAVTIPWGDVSTAFHTTGIPNIRVYVSASPAAVRRMKRGAHFIWLLHAVPLRRLVQRIASRRTGPDAETRASARTYLWGEVADTAGHRVSRTMETPDGYAFTAMSAVSAVERVLAGRVEPGPWTPARAFGSGFVEEIPGVSVQPFVREG